MSERNRPSGIQSTAGRDMRSLAWWLVAIAVAWLVATEASAQGEKPESWRDTARACGLSTDEVEHLARHHALLGRKTFRQVTEAYGEVDTPVFVTTDSLLNAFHALVEESFTRLESAQTIRLKKVLANCRAILPDIEKHLVCDSDLLVQARRRADITLAVAHALLEEHDADKAQGKPLDDIASEVEAEVDRILAARDMVKPAWLGPPDRRFHAIDYNRCSPRGFYTSSEALQRYFRAISWLQAIPFRVDRDEELLAILLLGRAFNRVGRTCEPPGDQARESRICRGYLPLNSIIGLPDDWDVYRAGDFADTAKVGPFARSGTAGASAAPVNRAQLQAIRAVIVDTARRTGHRSLIQDQVRWVPTELAFRVLAACRTPSGILFGRTTNREDKTLDGRSVPSGLEIAALLGDTYAMDTLAKEPGVLAIIRSSDHLLEGESFYLDYLRCLKRLTDAPDPEAPAFMRSDVWRVKKTNTLLAGWAQIRHTFVLHAKVASYPLGVPPKPTGFVEPEPVFYREFSRLVRSAREIFERGGALGSDPGAVAPDLRVIARKLDAFVSPTSNREDAVGSFLLKLVEENPLGWQYRRLLRQLWHTGLKDIKTNPERLDRAREVLRAFIAKLESATPLDDSDLQAALERSQQPFRSHWDKLEQLCLQLERLARKQLRGEAFSGPETEFISDYGQALGEIMGFAGHTYLYPADTAARVADVFSVPDDLQPEKGFTVHVGIARPRALWVLYPWHGRLLLCRGAVLPYHEFSSPTRLSDREWRARLVPGRRPDLPSWLSRLRPTAQ